MVLSPKITITIQLRYISNIRYILKDRLYWSDTNFMGKLIKWLIYLLITGLSVLIIYAFAGPLIFGVEFEPQQTLIWNTIKLNAN